MVAHPAPRSVARPAARPAPLPWRLVLGGCAVAVLSLWGAGLLQDLWLAGDAGADRVWVLDPDFEGGTLTWASILLLFSAAALLFQSGQDALARGAAAAPWFLLAGLFALLSFDEFGGLHERVSGILSDHVDTGGVFLFAWAAPAGVLALLGLVAMRPFLRSLDRRTAGLMLASAGVYLGGAVGMEMLGGLAADRGGMTAAPYRLLVNAEEGLEASGVLLFIFTLLERRERL